MKEAEQILSSYRLEDPYDDLEPMLSIEEIKQYQEEVKEVTIADDVKTYLLQIIEKTRNHEDIELGISPRGMLALMRASQARAFLAEREYEIGRASCRERR